MGDMFSLYKYENQLYVMRLTGKEIKNYLEMSYNLWTNTMKSPDDHLLLLSNDTRDDSQRLGFKTSRLIRLCCWYRLRSRCNEALWTEG